MYFVRKVCATELNFSISVKTDLNCADLIKSLPTKTPPTINPIITRTIESSTSVKPFVLVTLHLLLGLVLQILTVRFAPDPVIKTG